MSLQTKFFMYFLLIGVLPMVFLGIFSFSETENRLIDSTLDHLESVASLQEARINEMLDRYIREAKSITSRTQLRISLNEYAKTGESIHVEKINKIILDAKNSDINISVISVMDTSGRIIGSTDLSRVGDVYEDMSAFSAGLRSTKIINLFKDKDNNILHLSVVGQMILDGDTIGVAEIISKAEPIIAITRDYTGLGETGEVTLALKNKIGDALFITPLRFNAGAALNEAVSSEVINNPMVRVLDTKEESVFRTGSTVDYRGVSIYAVSRHIEAPDWGLVAKIDQEEALRESKTFRSVFFLILIFLLFLVVLASLFVSNTMASPLIKLTLKTRALEKGDFSSRIKIDRKDEIGDLARAFNNMTEKLQDLYKNLETKVVERTEELTASKEKMEEKLDEVERLNKVMVGRELEMIKMKEEIKTLKKKNDIG